MTHTRGAGNVRIAIVCSSPRQKLRHRQFSISIAAAGSTSDAMTTFIDTLRQAHAQKGKNPATFSPPSKTL
jgi:hypothetical protein